MWEHGSIWKRFYELKWSRCGWCQVAIYSKMTENARFLNGTDIVSRVYISENGSPYLWPFLRWNHQRPVPSQRESNVQTADSPHKGPVMRKLCLVMVSLCVLTLDHLCALCTHIHKHTVTYVHTHAHKHPNMAHICSGTQSTPNQPPNQWEADVWAPQ